MIQDLSSGAVPPGFPGKSKVLIQFWYVVQATLFRCSFHAMYGWRAWLLRRFGAKIGKGVKIRPSATITYPWNVTIGDHSYVGDEAVLYSLTKITIGNNVSISYRCFLCTGSHDPKDKKFPLTLKEIHVGNEAWLAADVFCFPGAVIERGAIISARSTFRGRAKELCIYSGNPAVYVSERQLVSE